MSSQTPRQRLLQAGRKTRDSLRVIRDMVRLKRKEDAYNEVFVRLDEAVEGATDGLIEIAQLFEEVLIPGSQPASAQDVEDVRALQESLEDMKQEREGLVKSLRDAQVQLQRYADDLQKLYKQEREKRAELAEAYERLQEATRLKTEFLTTINHELTSPLVPIDLNLQLIRKNTLNVEQRENLDKAHEQLQKYKRQLDGIIKYADLVNQPYLINRREVEVAPLVENVLAPLERLARGRQIDLRVNPVPEGMTVWADPDLLGSLIYQVTHNAIKFNSPGGHVEVSIYRDAGGTVFEFRDDGPGIPEHVLDRLGQDFNQIVDSLRRGEEGLGLGLALSYHVAQVHNGELNAENLIPRGAQVVLWLPEGVG